MADERGTPKTGFMMCLYYSDTLNGTGTDILISAVEDVSLSNVAREMIELAHRGTKWKKKLAGMMEAPTVEFKLFHNIEPAVERALWSHLTSAEPFLLKVMNGPIDEAGSEGFSMPVLLSEMPWSQGLSEVSARDVKCELAYAVHNGSEVEPEWITTA